MHNEAFIFTNLNITNQIKFNLEINKEELEEEIKFIEYKSGLFYKGQRNKNYLTFDIENTTFLKK